MAAAVDRCNLEILSYNKYLAFFISFLFKNVMPIAILWGFLAWWQNKTKSYNANLIKYVSIFVKDMSHVKMKSYYRLLFYLYDRMGYMKIQLREYSKF